MLWILELTLGLTKIPRKSFTTGELSPILKTVGTTVSVVHMNG